MNAIKDSVPIILAAVHSRYDMIEGELRRLGYVVHRVRGKDELTLEFVDQQSPDWIFVPHWSWKIPREIFENYRCIVFHMTDLPFGRGGSPLQNLIVSGFESTKISALQCVEEMDAGPIFLKRSLSLLGTAEEILMRASGVILEMIKEMLASVPIPKPQRGKPTYFTRRSQTDGDMQLLSELKQLYDHIRMLDAEGYPHAFLETPNFHLEFSRASLRPDHIRADVTITKKPR